jgi:hypothetical protein
MRVLSNFNLNGCKRRPLSLMTLLLFSLRKERKRVGEILKSLLIIEGVGKFRKILDYQTIKGEKNINEYTKSNCRDLRKRGTSTLLKDLIDQCQFHFNGLQETMVENNEDSLIRKFDPQQNYL